MISVWFDKISKRFLVQRNWFLMLDKSNEILSILFYWLFNLFNDLFKFIDINSLFYHIFRIDIFTVEFEARLCPERNWIILTVSKSFWTWRLDEALPIKTDMIDLKPIWSLYIRGLLNVHYFRMILAGKKITDFIYVVFRWQQDKYGKEARDETEGKSSRVHRGMYKMKKEI